MGKDGDVVDRKVAQWCYPEAETTNQSLQVGFLVGDLHRAVRAKIVSSKQGRSWYW